MFNADIKSLFNSLADYFREPVDSTSSDMPEAVVATSQPSEEVMHHEKIVVIHSLIAFLKKLESLRRYGAVEHEKKLRMESFIKSDTERYLKMLALKKIKNAEDIRVKEELRNIELQDVELNKNNAKKRLNGQKTAALNEKRKLLKLATNTVLAHKYELRSKYLQLNIKGDYGIIDASGWLKERKKFIDLILCPAIGRDETDLLELEVLQNLVDKFASAPTEQGTDENSIQEMTGLEYELFCADLLKTSGWAVTLTKGSGDQGVDLIAEKNTLKLAIQCKRYLTPVGNAAVQEICAGMKFAQAHHGAVVSNAAFTPHAKQLAKITNILLLHHSALCDVESLLVANK
jgi:restriction system protein